jgi:hypothetical protein
MDDTKGLAIAFEEAQASFDEGGIPVTTRSSLTMGTRPVTIDIGLGSDLAMYRLAPP